MMMASAFNFAHATNDEEFVNHTLKVILAGLRLFGSQI